MAATAYFDDNQDRGNGPPNYAMDKQMQTQAQTQAHYNAGRNTNSWYEQAPPQAYYKNERKVPGYAPPNYDGGRGQRQPPVVHKQPVPSSFVIVQRPPPPKTYIYLAIISCAVFNPFTGIPAIINSILSKDAYQNGDVEEAKSRGKMSLLLSVTGMISWLILGIVIVILNW